MRVLHITEGRGWSGGTVQLWNLCRALKDRGHEVALVCPPDSELLKRLNGGVRAAPVPLRQDYDLPAARRIARAIADFRPDVVHAHHPRAHALALLAGFFGVVPRLVVSRRVSFRLPAWNPFSRWKYRTNRVRRYAAVSEDIKDVLVRGGVPAERVEVVHSGVDVDKFAPRPPDEALRRALGVPDGVPLIGNLNHYSWWKGQRAFLEAARRLLDGGVRAHFLLAGKDTDGPELRSLVESLGLGAHVTLAGFRTDVPEILSLLSASAVCSLAGEGFSGVLRESMSMGVPVVATSVGGNAELVQDGRTGFLVPPGDAPALAAAFARLLSDRPAAGRMAREAQENVRSRYSIAAMVDRTIRLYGDLLRDPA